VSFGAVRAVSAKRFACTSVLSLGLALVFVVMTANASSRDEVAASHPKDPEASLVSVTPYPGATLIRKPSAGECVANVLLVPEITVNTHVLALGTDSDGKQQLPDNPIEVSWWKGGAVPGQPGNAVFAGHTWSQGDGVFDRLSELSDGDIVKVRGDGCELAFVVDSVHPDVPANLPSNEVQALYSTTGPSGMVLYTCGDFDGREYHSRIVAHAHLVE
jgi:LPXTG-site transpeptidase (sortase) family protein